MSSDLFSDTVKCQEAKKARIHRKAGKLPRTCHSEPYQKKAGHE
jgi:hypothetical protein